MTDLGLELQINPSVIEACKNDNTDINQAVFDMLYNKWYESILLHLLVPVIIALEQFEDFLHIPLQNLEINPSELPPPEEPRSHFQ